MCNATTGDGRLRHARDKDSDGLRCAGLDAIQPLLVPRNDLLPHRERTELAIFRSAPRPHRSSHSVGARTSGRVRQQARQTRRLVRYAGVDEPGGDDDPRRGQPLVQADISHHHHHSHDLSMRCQSRRTVRGRLHAARMEPAPSCIRHPSRRPRIDHIPALQHLLPRHLSRRVHHPHLGTNPHRALNADKHVRGGPIPESQRRSGLFQLFVANDERPQPKETECRCDGSERPSARSKRYGF